MPIQLTVEGTTEYEVECSICKAETAQNEIRAVLCDPRLPLALRVQLVTKEKLILYLHCNCTSDLMF